MRLLIILFSLSMLLVSAPIVQAKTIKAEVSIKTIRKIKSSEHNKDELFFSISNYPSDGEPNISRVPMFPLHWSDNKLDEVTGVKLWQGQIADKQSVLLILSLIEQDLPPWNTNEHVGSAKLKILNTASGPQVTWGQPDFHDQPQVKQQGKLPSYRMYGAGGEYQVEFNLEAG